MSFCRILSYYVKKREKSSARVCKALRYNFSNLLNEFSLPFFRESKLFFLILQGEGAKALKSVHNALSLSCQIHTDELLTALAVFLAVGEVKARLLAQLLREFDGVLAKSGNIYPKKVGCVGKYGFQSANPSINIFAREAFILKHIRNKPVDPLVRARKSGDIRCCGENIRLSYLVIIKTSVHSVAKLLILNYGKCGLQTCDIKGFRA